MAKTKVKSAGLPKPRTAVTAPKKSGVGKAGSELSKNVK